MYRIFISLLILTGCTTRVNKPVELGSDSGMFEWVETETEPETSLESDTYHINIETNLVIEAKDATVATDAIVVPGEPDLEEVPPEMVIEEDANEIQDSGQTDSRVDSIDTGTAGTGSSSVDTGTADSGIEKTDSGTEYDAGNDTDSATDPIEPDPCENGVQEESETDVDCGGTCARCEVDQSCVEDSDCQEDLVCLSGVCEIAKTCPIPTNGYPGLAKMTCVYYIESAMGITIPSTANGIDFLTKEQMKTATRCMAEDPLVYAHTHCKNSTGGYCPANYQDCIWNIPGTIGQCEHLGCNANIVWNPETKHDELRAVQWIGDP